MPHFVFTIVPQLTVQAPDLASAEAFIKSLEFESGAVAIKAPGVVLVPGAMGGPKRKRLPMAVVRCQRIVLPGEEAAEAPQPAAQEGAAQ